MSTDDPTLGRDIEAAARLTGMFRLRSGATSATYFDKYRFESDPELLRRLARAMVARLPADAEVLAGLELGGVPIATAMSLASGLPAVFVRKAAKPYGTCRAVEGGEIAGRRIVIVEDVVTTGGQVVASAALLREAGATISAVVCAIRRGLPITELDALPGVPLSAVLTVSS